MPISLRSLVLSAQGALWGNIVPEFRAVYVEADLYCFSIYFYHDGPLTEVGAEMMEDTVTEVTADFYFDPDGTEYTFSYGAMRVDCPQPPPHLGCCVYFRHEQIPCLDILNYEYLQACLAEDPTAQYLGSDVEMMVNTALLGYVTPNLRGVTFRVIGRTVEVNFYFDGTLSSSENMLVQNVMARLQFEMASWAPTQQMTIESKVIRFDLPQDRRSIVHQDGTRGVYWRYEGWSA